MIVLPRNNAPVRLALPSRARRTPLAMRALLAVAMLLGLPSVATAAGGGVSITSTTSTAKGSSAADTTDAAPSAPTDPTFKPKSVGKNQIRRAQTLLRIAATGSNDTATRKVVKRFQGLRGLPTYGIIDVTTYLQIKDAFALLETGGAGVDITTDTGGGATVSDTPAPIALPANLAPITATERAILDRIAQCESQDDPKAVSANGLYRGKYQFDRSTWKQVGGTGDPAAASEVEQDQRAAILLRQKGTSPWPVCGQA